MLAWNTCRKKPGSDKEGRRLTAEPIKKPTDCIRGHGGRSLLYSGEILNGVEAGTGLLPEIIPEYVI